MGHGAERLEPPAPRTRLGLGRAGVAGRLLPSHSAMTCVPDGLRGMAMRPPPGPVWRRRRRLNHAAEPRARKRRLARSCAARQREASAHNQSLGREVRRGSLGARRAEGHRPLEPEATCVCRRVRRTDSMLSRAGPARLCCRIGAGATRTGGEGTWQGRGGGGLSDAHPVDCSKAHHCLILEAEFGKSCRQAQSQLSIILTSIVLQLYRLFLRPRNKCALYVSLHQCFEKSCK